MSSRRVGGKGRNGRSGFGNTIWPLETSFVVSIVLPRFGKSGKIIATSPGGCFAVVTGLSSISACYLPQFEGN